MDERIVVLGAGFGGALAARRIRKLAPPSTVVEIIDDNNYFVFQPLLPEVASGSVPPADAVVPLRAMLPGVHTREARVVAIDFPGRHVEVVQGRRRTLTRVPYDHLVIALGQATDLSRYPGLSEHAFVMRDVADAFTLRSHVIDCLEQADVTADAEWKRRLLTFIVIGGGLSGVETLGEIERMITLSLRFYPNVRRQDVRLVMTEFLPAILPEMPPDLAAYAARKLQERGVEIITGVGLKSASIDSVELADGRIVNTATIVATIGSAPSSLVRSLPLPKVKGRIAVDPTLRVIGHTNVWSLGDVAAVPLDDGRFAPPSAQAASQEADCLADNLMNARAGRPLRAFSFHFRGQLASLGGHRGVAAVFGRHISGRLAWVLWRWVYLAMLPGWSSRIRVAVDWMLDAILPRTIVELRPRKASPIRRLRFRQGEVVFGQGDATGPLYAVVSGSFQRRGGGMDGTIGKGGHFGEGGLQGERRRRATVTAMEDSICMVIDGEDVDGLLSCIEAFGPYLAELRPSTPPKGVASR